MISRFFKVLHEIRKTYWRLAGIKTSGVRVMLIDGNRILLVSHRYNPDWVMPGGGIKKNQTEVEAARAELYEETGICADFLYCLGKYKNTAGGKNDTVHCLIFNNPKSDSNFRKPILSYFEISKVCWFDINNLPQTTSISTKKRIAEYKSGARDLVGDW